MGNRCSKQCSVHISGCRSAAAPTEEKTNKVVPACKKCAMRQLQALRDSSFRAGFELGLRHPRQSLRPASIEPSLDKLIKDDFKWVVQHPPEEDTLQKSPNHISLP